MAEANERGTEPSAERDALFALLMGSVIRFEMNAQADVEAFRRMHNDVMRSLLDGHHNGDGQASVFSK